MAKSKKRKSSGATRVVYQKARRAVRRSRRSGILSNIIPGNKTLINGAAGGAGYVVGYSLAGKYLNMTGIAAGAVSALATHMVLGNMVLKSSEVGAGAVGAFAADALRQSGVLASIGLSDYFGDYIHDSHVALPVGGGSVMIGTGISPRVGVHDPGRHHHRGHHIHDYISGGEYSAYGGY